MQNSIVVFSFMVSKESQVKINIYNRNGRNIKEFISDSHPGRNTVTWDGNSNSGNSVPAGCYIVTVPSEEYVLNKRFNFNP